jgi:hypothetical protein
MCLCFQIRILAREVYVIYVLSSLDTTYYLLDIVALILYTLTPNNNKVKKQNKKLQIAAKPQLAADCSGVHPPTSHKLAWICMKSKKLCVM